MSRLVVQKYGGSVLRDEDSVRRVARVVAATAAAGDPVVVVVSALASVTDRQLERAARFSAGSSTTGAVDLLVATGEIESASLLALALAELGVPAEPLNPWQMGLHTDGAAGGARIVRINPLPLWSRIEAGRVLVVPGFVGRSDDGRLTTLGRGGSDLTAVALAGALRAGRCEFFKDVAGYFSADPALVPHARHCPEITIDEALELARAGCRFLQDRAVEWAASAECRISLHAVDDARTTTIVRRRDGPPRVVATTHGVAADGGLGLVSLVGDAAAIRDPATVRDACEALSAAGIPGRIASLTDHRLTVEVPLDRLSESHLLVHDHFFDVAATPGRPA